MDVPILTSLNETNILKLGTEQLAKILKNSTVNLHNKAKGHYREMAWMPFQKVQIRMTSFMNAQPMSAFSVIAFSIFFT